MTRANQNSCVTFPQTMATESECSSTSAQCCGPPLSMIPASRTLHSDCSSVRCLVLRRLNVLCRQTELSGGLVDSDRMAHRTWFWGRPSMATSIFCASVCCYRYVCPWFRFLVSIPCFSTQCRPIDWAYCVFASLRCELLKLTFFVIVFSIDDSHDDKWSNVANWGMKLNRDGREKARESVKCTHCMQHGRLNALCMNLYEGELFLELFVSFALLIRMSRWMRRMVKLERLVINGKLGVVNLTAPSNDWCEVE